MHYTLTHYDKQRATEYVKTYFGLDVEFAGRSEKAFDGWIKTKKFWHVCEAFVRVLGKPIKQHSRYAKFKVDRTKFISIVTNGEYVFLTLMDGPLS